MRLPRITIFNGMLNAMNMIAVSVNDLLRSKQCKNVDDNISRQCLVGHRLTKQLAKTSYAGLLGTIFFDKNGDYLGKYSISQISRQQDDCSTMIGDNYCLQRVGKYNSQTKVLSSIGDLILTADHNISREPFLSQCSEPCKGHEARIFHGNVCCWVCQRCRPNQQLVDDKTRCRLCPPFTWPDGDNEFLTCIDIPPTTLMISSISGVMMAIFWCIAAFVYGLLLFGYLRYRRW